MTLSDSVRDEVRKRAKERCEYCLRPDFVDTGRVTVRLFQMNHPKVIDIRRDLIEAGLW